MLCTDKDTLIEVSICEGEEYDGHTTSGTYTEVIGLPFGCDSIVTLVLDVQEISYSQANILLCVDESIVINNEEYQFDESTTIIDTMFNADGCIAEVATYDVEVIGNFFENTGDIGLCIGELTTLSLGLEGSWALSLIHI